MCLYTYTYIYVCVRIYVYKMKILNKKSITSYKNWRVIIICEIFHKPTSDFIKLNNNFSFERLFVDGCASSS